MQWRAFLQSRKMPGRLRCSDLRWLQGGSRRWRSLRLRRSSRPKRSVTRYAPPAVRISWPIAPVSSPAAKRRWSASFATKASCRPPAVVRSMRSRRPPQLQQRRLRRRPRLRRRHRARRHQPPRDSRPPRPPLRHHQQRLRIRLRPAKPRAQRARRPQPSRRPRPRQQRHPRWRRLDRSARCCRGERL